MLGRYLSTIFTPYSPFYAFEENTAAGEIDFVTFDRFDRLPHTMQPKEFTEKVLSIKNKLYRYASKFVRDEEEAKDVVQDITLKLWLIRGDLNRYLNFESLAMRMTRNLCLDRIKALGYRSDPLPDTLMIKCNAFTPYETVEHGNLTQLIDLMIARLPLKQQEILHLRDVEGLSYQEIGDILHIDLNQVKINLFRARKTLRENVINLNAYGLQSDRKPS